MSPVDTEFDCVAADSLVQVLKKNQDANTSVNKLFS
jgi:hypothetical protein